MKFKIEITETLQEIVEVEAKNLTEAITSVEKDYNDGKIVLDSMNFVCYEINKYKEA